MKVVDLFYNLVFSVVAHFLFSYVNNVGNEQGLQLYLLMLAVRKTIR